MTPYPPCPKCGNANATPVKWTWWGGALGPRSMTQVKCGSCGTNFNGKTGKLISIGIVIYMMIAGVIAFLIFFVIAVAIGYLSVKR